MKLEGKIRHGMDINVGSAGSWTTSVAFGPVIVSGGSGVQSDWSETDSSSMAYIKNKPTIPATQVQSDWSQSDSTAVDYIKNKPTIPTIPAMATQSEINLGSSVQLRSFTPKLMHENAYITETSLIPSTLAPNKLYNFNTISSALAIPNLSLSGLVSNALNFYALRFIAGTDNISITFPTGVVVDDEPTINTGDYVEIMINKYGTNYYANIKVWQAQ